MPSMDRSPLPRPSALAWAACALATLLPVAASAQIFSKAQKAAAKPAAASAPAPADDGVARILPKELPVNPSDPIAVVNGEVITRMQLADECVARKGKEVLETLIAGKLIDQAVAGRRMTITPQEIEDETEAIAQSMGVAKANWLRTLDKERGISPMQYKRDIVYRVIALRKLAEPGVQVTDDDLKKAYEANYGEKLHYRVIMTDSLQSAKAIWNELKQNPAAFERVAKEKSIDTETKPVGGLALQPMSRHAYPLNVSQAAFEQLVDGDPQDKDPEHKPKDGDITGPIQVSEGSWLILRREKVEAAKPYDPDNQEERARYREMLKDVKLKDAMRKVYEQIVENSTVDNKLTGQTRLAKEKDHPASRQDEEVKLMSNPDAKIPSPSNQPPKALVTPKRSAPAAPDAAAKP